jgi:ABC-type sugar transport system permease subunit
MATISQETVQQPHPTSLPPVIMAGMVWSLIVAAFSVYFALQIFNADAFDVRPTMGNFVQNFFGVVALLPAALSLFSVAGFVLLWNNTPPANARLLSPANARYSFVTVNYLGMVLSGFYLLHLWEVFVGLDAITGAIYENRVWIWGLVASYFLFWFAGRLSHYERIHDLMERVALLLAMGTTIILLIESDLVGAFEHIVNQYDSMLVWATTIAAIIFGVFAFSVLQMSKLFGESPEQRKAWQGWLMVSPSIIGFSLFLGGPLLLSFYLSFTDATVQQVPNFIGLDNYAEIMSIQVRVQGEDDEFALNALDDDYSIIQTVRLADTRYVIGGKDHLFWLSLRNTIVFGLMLVPLATIPAIALAVVLDSNLPGVKFYRAVYFLPSVAAVVGTALIWRSALYSSQIGYINYAISEVVNFLNSTFGLSIVDPEPGWLTDSDLQLFSVVLITAWQVVGFNTVLFLAGLQGIPTVLYEAASVDGANRWQQFRKVTLPLLAPTTFFVVVTTIINALQVFNEVFVLYGTTQGVPEEVTTGVYHLYNQSFSGENFAFGYASAIAWVLFALIFSITLLQFRVSRSNETQ